jgi:hypothetical protein
MESLNEYFSECGECDTYPILQYHFEAFHENVMNLAETFSNDELFEKNVYKWVGGSTLGSYFISVASSHYDWAIKKLKAHIKNCKNI